MSRMALEKDDFRRFSVIWEFRVTGNWVKARVATRVKMDLNWPQARAWSTSFPLFRLLGTNLKVQVSTK